MFEKLKSRWGLDSAAQVVAILLVFSLAGMSILPLRKWVFHLLHFDGRTPVWLKILTWLLLVFPSYQVFLLLYGALLGQFQFFWEKERKMLQWIRSRFSQRSETPA